MINLVPIKKMIRRHIKLFSSKYGWFGDFPSWQDAEKLCSGYDAEEIFNRVFKSALRVKNGEIPYERDSVGYSEIQYSWPILSCLLYIALKNGNNLNIIDFGGAFGSSYFQNKEFIDCLESISWNIVEQPHFIEAGKHYFENDALHFYNSIDDCIREQNPNTIFFSSSLQYISDPDALLEEVMKHKGFEYLLFDLLGITDEQHSSRITIQKVSPQIYDASFPCWFFNENELTQSLASDFTLIESFDSYIGKSILIDNKQAAKYKGYLFERKNG